MLREKSGLTPTEIALLIYLADEENSSARYQFERETGPLGDDYISQQVKPLLNPEQITARECLRQADNLWSEAAREMGFSARRFAVEIPPHRQALQLADLLIVMRATPNAGSDAWFKAVKQTAIKGIKAYVESPEAAQELDEESLHRVREPKNVTRRGRVLDDGKRGRE